MREIRYNGKILARHIRKEDIKEGLNFFSEENEFIQVGSWQYEKGKKLLPHIHNSVERIVTKTCECIYIVNGMLSAEIYNDDNEVLEKLIVKDGELLILLNGGHGYDILEDGTKVIEIKNGPYLGAEIDRKRI